MTLYSVLRRIKSEIYILFNRAYFGKMGCGCRIFSPLKIQGKRGIFLGNMVVVEHQGWLVSKGRLEIGDGTHLGHFNHIYATKTIKIGKNVLTADRVYISDNLHSYEDIEIPIMKQPIKQIAEVEIGEGTWIGEGVCVIGAKIGKGCVVGANAVVTKDIPDYSVAVGIPARIIKRYIHDTERWESVK